MWGYNSILVPQIHVSAMLAGYQIAPTLKIPSLDVIKPRMKRLWTRWTEISKCRDHTSSVLWSDPCKSDLIRSVLATVASCPESIKVHHRHIFDANGCRGNPELVQRIPTARSKPVKSRFSVARSDIPKTCGGGGGGGGGCLSSSASNSWLRPTPCNLVAKPEIFISGIIRGQARPFIGPGFVQGALKLLEPSPWWRCPGKRRKWRVSLWWCWSWWRGC